MIPKPLRINMEKESTVTQSVLSFSFQNILETKAKVMGPNSTFLVALQVQYKDHFCKEGKPVLKPH